MSSQTMMTPRTRRTVLGAGIGAIAVLAFPASALALSPGPPTVSVIAPEPVFTEPHSAPSFFEPGLIVLTFEGGGTISCEINPGPASFPPNPFCETTTR